MGVFAQTKIFPISPKIGSTLPLQTPLTASSFPAGAASLLIASARSAYVRFPTKKTFLLALVGRAKFVEPSSFSHDVDSQNLCTPQPGVGVFRKAKIFAISRLSAGAAFLSDRFWPGPLSFAVSPPGRSLLPQLGWAKFVERSSFSHDVDS